LSLLSFDNFARGLLAQEVLMPSNVTIRKITLEDAPSLHALKHQLDSESKFLMLEPGERPHNIDGEHQRIKDALESSNSMIFVAEVNNNIVGHLSVYGDSFKRNKHRVYIVIGILQAYTGQGIGQKLFEALDIWSREVGAHRLELTVMTHNQNAIKLYKKMGFEVEGIKRHSLIIDGEYVDEFYMAKLL
jgi:RimJ/RimL family protein N-acetyltransferase